MAISNPLDILRFPINIIKNPLHGYANGEMSLIDKVEKSVRDPFWYLKPVAVGSVGVFIDNSLSIKFFFLSSYLGGCAIGDVLEGNLVGERQKIGMMALAFISAAVFGGLMSDNIVKGKFLMDGFLTGSCGFLGCALGGMLSFIFKKYTSLNNDVDFCKSILENYTASLPIGESTDSEENLGTKRGFLDAVEIADPTVLNDTSRILVEELIKCDGDITNQNSPSFLHVYLRVINDIPFRARNGLKNRFQNLLEVDRASFSLLKDSGHTDLERDARNLAGTFYTRNEILGPLSLNFSRAAKELKRVPIRRIIKSLRLFGQACGQAWQNT